MSVHA